MDMEEDDVPDGKCYCCDDCRKGKGVKRSRKHLNVAESLIDHKKNYTLLVMWRGLNQKVRRDAIRENDGDRIVLHWRFDMLQFYEKHHPKCFLICHRLLSAISGAAPPRLQHALTWNRTVNPHGGKGKNIAMDLQMEFYNKEYKESIKDAAGQLTSATIARHSQMVGIGKVLCAIYDKQVSGLSGRSVHKSGEVSRESDLKEFVSLLQEENLFNSQPGRKHPSFPEMSLNLYKNLPPQAFSSRLVRIKKEMSQRRQIISQMQRD